MRIGSLFSGIGGLELGLEWAGVGHTVWQVEQDEYCRAVLARHWPDAQRFTDVRTVGSGNLAPVDVICGGFPCQDVSATGRRRGIIAGTRSGLWFEYSRILRELRPRYAIVENVTGLLSLGLDAVLGELATIGYDAEWDCIPASALGAPHQRDRIFVVAYTQSDGLSQRRTWDAGLNAVATGGEWLWGEPRGSGPDAGTAPVANPEYRGVARGRRVGPTGDEGRGLRGVSGDESPRLQLQADALLAHPNGLNAQGIIARSDDTAVGGVAGERPTGLRSGAWGNRAWLSEPSVGRVAHGVPARAQRIKALGNAVVPQVAEVVGKVLLQIHQELGGVAA